ncbi:unnamed protein product [Nippostrongylus brasiliensis]|uniref:Uncharacterized protein n=1 Tax=Nippostrongylus brasiliensis TaxID=27835 RepID=A0A0N4YXI9_NIPBR|nr:unnamed protein product [Nippostrongylus brasiliensis]
MDQWRCRGGGIDKRLSTSFITDHTKDLDFSKHTKDGSPHSAEDIYVYGDEWSSDDDDATGLQCDDHSVVSVGRAVFCVCTF